MNNKYHYFAKSIFSALCYSSLLLSASSSFAADKEPAVNKNDLQDEEFSELLSLSLDELLNEKILSATSKQSESYIESPGIVSYITSQEIATMGANNLLDLLRRLPNIEVPSFYQNRNNVVSIRGQHSLTDKRTLVLLNGRPMRERHQGGLNAPIYTGFPLSSIKWIEVIRGPGSVLHGTGAFSGVVNIVTKTPEQKAAVNATVSYGSFNTRTLDATASAKQGDLAYSVGLKLLNMDGWEYAAYDTNEYGNQSSFDSIDYGEKERAATLELSYKNLSFSYFESQPETDILGTFPIWPADKAELQRRFSNIGYQHNISANWKADLNLTYNDVHTKTGGAFGEFGESIVNDNGGNSYLVELTGYGQLSEKINMILGGTLEQTSWFRDSYPVDDGSDHEKRAYTEFVYRPLDNIRLALGAQYNEAAGAEPNTSPRIAATFKITDSWGAKLLYGEAFRAANSIERYSEFPGSFTGNPSLNPETAETFDAQLFYYSDDLFAALSYYNSKELDTIVLDFSQDPGTFINADGEIKYHGAEFEFRWNILNNLKANGSYSYQSNINADREQGTKLTPHRMAKIGLSYFSDKGFSLGVFDSFFSDYSNHDPEGISVYNTKGSAYHHLSANLTFDINTLAGFKSDYRSKIIIFGDNLLEKDTLYAPDLARSEINTLPIRAGRAVYVRYQLEL